MRRYEVESVTLVQECRGLEEEFGTAFRRVDRTMLIKKCDEMLSLQTLREVLDGGICGLTLGLRHTRAQSRRLCHHGRAVRTVGMS